MRQRLGSRLAGTAARVFAAAVLGALAAACGSSGDGGEPVPPRPGGLDARPANLSCTAPPRNGGEAGIELVREFQDLDFEQPLGMLQAPGDDSRWFVLEKTGRVRVFANDPATGTASDFIDLDQYFDLNTSSEGGLLGMAFHPEFTSNGHVYLSWTENSPMVSVVARFTSGDGGQTLDPGTQRDIVRLNQDFDNHNGGHVAFGPDGYLYVGFGDGGSGGDPNGRAQDTTNLLGALLRLDVDGGAPFAVPPDNPFAGNPACPADPNVSANDCPEIYAWGLRNPWRFSFDTATGGLWLGDVGQNAWEEVDRIELGGNYGWDCREGASPFGSPAPSCASAQDLIDPVHQYPRSEGISLTGGYVYRGGDVPALAGSYVFGDFGSGRIWRLVDDGAGGLTDEALLETDLAISSFGQADDGELYVVDYGGGGLYRIAAAAGSDPSGPPSGPAVAALLSDTGCVDAGAPAEPAAGLIPYTVTAPFWSDAATKARWLAIPDGTAIGVGTDGDFSLPPGSVVLKHFRLDGRLLETRLLMRHPDGGWAGYTYEWAADGSDAALVQGGKTVPVGGQDWIYPSQSDCLVCHTAAAGFSLGLETAQLNAEFTYPSTGRTANQLETLDAVAMFTNPLGDPAAQAALADPFDGAAAVGDRARAYLHTNCAQCHRAGGTTPSSMDLRFHVDLAAAAICGAVPQSGDLGLGAGARIVAPGDPALSVLAERMRRRDASAMPPLASNRVDAAGVELIEAWITDLACP